MNRTLASSLVLSLLIGCGGGSDGAFEPADGDVEDASTDGGAGPDATSDATADATSDGGCAAGATEQETCGKCGKRLRVCNGTGSWSDWSVCNGETGACAPGDTETETCADGRKRTRTCAETCAWGAFGDCEGTPTCTAGTIEQEACGNCGKRVRVCGADKAWSDWSACDAKPDACAPGATEEQACGIGGKQTRACSSSCTWGAFGACVGGVTPCSPGALEKRACGFCGEELRVCGSDMLWSDWSACSGAGECAAGTTQSSACGDGGTRTRTCDASCKWGGYGICSSDLDDQVWVVRLTPDPASKFTSVPAFVDRIGLDGSLLGSIALPTAAAGANHPFTLPGNDTDNDGHLVRSGDGRFVTIGGYAAPPGTASVDNSSLPRAIANIGASGVVDTSRTTTALGSLVRGAATSDGATFWIWGLNGLRHYPSGVQIDSAPLRMAAVIEGNLWASGVEDDLARFTGLPTTAAAPSELDPVTAGYINSPSAFVAVSRAGGTVDTAYVADSNYSGGPSSGLVRYVRTGGTWTRSGVLPMGFASGEIMSWITGRVEGSNVVLWGSVVSGGASRVIRFVDVGGASPSFTPTTVYMAPAGQKLRGISLPPRP